MLKEFAHFFLMSRIHFDAFYTFFFFFLVYAGSSLLQGLFPNCSAQVSHCSGFSCCRAQALGVQASVGAARGLSS